MESPPLTTTTTTPVAATYPTHLNYQDLVDSSHSPRSRSRNVDTWDEPLLLVPGAKLRLMFSYGGHIIPRPHDKSLCYVGGETRIVLVDYHSTLADLCTRLSYSLLNGRPFTLKYQLPNEDLDSLISVSTDEDLENMIEEYERMTSTSPLKQSRLRLFLFFSKPETAASMGALLDDAKSETWFVDALNNSNLLPRNLSDSATMDCLLNLDRVVRGSDSCNDLQAEQGDFTSDQINDQLTMKNNVHGIQTMLDFPVIENTCSFGSSSCSSPSTTNLPPIRLRVNNDNEASRLKDQRIGIEEQFAQISFAPPSIPTMVMTTTPGTMVSSAMVNHTTLSEEITNRVFSDDEKSDHGMSAGCRKPPLAPLQPLQHKAGSAGFSLPAPDSVASDTSTIASASSLSEPMYYQDQVHVTQREIGAPTENSNAMNENVVISSGSEVLQQAKGSNYVMPQQQQYHHHQQQYMHAIYARQSPYYPIYAPQSQHHQQILHHPNDHHQQYPIYVMPVPQTHNRQTSQSNIPNSTTYKDSNCIPPSYPTKNNASSAIPLHHIPSNQFQQQYLDFDQMHAQSIPVANPANAYYGFEYPNNHPSHEQIYYTQHPAAPLPSQYQSKNPASAVIALSDDSKQMPLDQNNTQQQSRTSQPV